MKDANDLVDFLGKLATDDDFRKRYEKSPAKILASYGIEIPEETEAALPPKDVLVAALQQLAEATTLPGSLGSGMEQYWPTWIGPFPPTPWSRIWRGPFPTPWRPIWRGPFPFVKKDE